MKLIVDVMGTDLGALPILEALHRYIAEEKMTKLVLVGVKAQIETILATLEPAIPAANYEIIAADEVIHADDGVLAVRRHPQASLVVAFRLLQQGYGNALISGGSTAHFVAAAHLMIPKLPLVKKPGYMVFIPTVKAGKLVTAVDVGANLNNSAYDLFVYAFLARCFVQNVFQIPEPQVGLVNIGTESSKGQAFQQRAHQLLTAASELHFLGNVEPSQLFAGNADILLTDGYSGNLVLKTAEGAAAHLFQTLKETLKSNWATKMKAALLQKSFQTLKEKFDYRNYAGAVMIGLEKLVVKTHGSVDAKSFYSALKTLTVAYNNKVMVQFADWLATHEEQLKQIT